MKKVIGVKFRNSCKVYTFDSGEEIIEQGKSVIVETSRGTEIGVVMVSTHEVEEEEVVQPLKPVIRLAVTEDFDLIRANKEKEKEAFQICREKISEHGLEMKLVDVEYTFDGSKVLFYFTADGRIDFRELVKDLAAVFRTRIELRQIGVRDETKILGGMGICGRSLCCHSYLSDFVPVSIKMAKEQNLSLNPTKISGVCGRLMCCLKNEEDTYEYLNAQLPKLGEMATVTAEGIEGEVQSINVLRQRVRLLVKTVGDEIEARDYPVAALDFGPGRKPPVKAEGTSALRFREDAVSQEDGKTGETQNRSGRRAGSRLSRSESEESRQQPERGSRRERTEGRQNERSSRQERVEGRQNERSSRQERAEGWQNEKSSRQERAEGWQNEKSGRQEHAEGWQNEKSSRQERAEGRQNERSSRRERADSRQNDNRQERADSRLNDTRQERIELARNERNARRERRNEARMENADERVRGNGQSEESSARSERSARTERAERNERASRPVKAPHINGKEAAGVRETAAQADNSVPFTRKSGNVRQERPSRTEHFEKTERTGRRRYRPFRNRGQKQSGGGKPEA